MNNPAFDKLLRSALLDAVAQDYETVLTTADDDTAIAFSRRHQRRMKRMLRNPFSYAQKQTAPQWRRTLKTAVAAALILITIAFSASMLFIPEVRATVVRIVTEWFDTHASFIFAGGSSEYTGTEYWYPQHLPEGYEETSRVDLSGYVTINYQNAEGRTIDLDYCPATQGGGFNIDNYRAEHYETTINGHPAYLFEYQTDNSKQLIWFSKDEATAFKIMSDLDSDELIKVAESMQENN